MSARHKLNSAHCVGIALVAGLLGLAADSLLVGLIAAGLLFALNLQDGNIRPDPPAGPRRRR